MEHIEAVIFDMDGTLVDSESVSRRAWDRAARDCGFEISEELSRSFIGRNAFSVRALLVEYLGGGEGAGAVVDRAFALRHEYFEELSANELKLMDGAREALEELAAKGVPMALATSTMRDRAIPRLEKFGIDGFFASITCGEDVEHGKPAPDIFLLAAERMGAEPACCAVIEDSHNGVRAGHAAGAQVIMVPDLVPPTREIEGMCVKVLDSLCELPEVICKLGA